jgi:hypothetical protein
MEAGFGPSSIASTLVNLGAVARDLGQRSAAIKHLREALALEVEAFGAASGDVQDTRNNLAGSLVGEGQIDEELNELSLVLDTQSKRVHDLIALGTDDAERLSALAATELELQAYLGLASLKFGSDPSLVVTPYWHVLARKGLVTCYPRLLPGPVWQPRSGRSGDPHKQHRRVCAPAPSRSCVSRFCRVWAGSLGYRS